MALGFGFDLMSQAVRQRPWTPRFLFGDGEQGAWYDPSDFSTLYQDSAGTTPVTALGQPVGLMLDKSQGGKPTGPELIANGDFSQWSSDNPVDWTVVAAETAGSFVTQSGNAARIVSDGSYMGISQSGFTTGKVYRVEFDVLAVDTGFLVSMGGGSTVAIDSTGHKAFLLAAGASNFGFYRDFSVGAVDFTVTNISVREIPGNHASQATTAAMPYVQARVNLLERTEEFENEPPWNKANLTITANDAVAPDGTTTADRVTSTGDAFLDQILVLTNGQQYTFSVWLRSTTASPIATQLRIYDNIPPIADQTNVLTPVTATSSWQRFSTTFTAGVTGNHRIGIGANNTLTSGEEVYIWGAQLEQNSSATTYQRVTTATDYADIGLPRYLEFDGVDDAMATQSVDFTGTDEMTAVIGVESVFGTTATLVELSDDPNTNSGVFNIFRRVDGSYGYGYWTPFQRIASSGVYTGTDQSILTLQADSSAPSILGRRNGVQVDQNLSSAGGTFGDYPLYIGARNDGASNELNGRIHQLIIRGATTAGALLDQTERFVARKTGVTL